MTDAPTRAGSEKGITITPGGDPPPQLAGSEAGITITNADGIETAASKGKALRGVDTADPDAADAAARKATKATAPRKSTASKSTTKSTARRAPRKSTATKPDETTASRASGHVGSTASAGGAKP